MLDQNMNGSQVIDLLTISHFDQDHISGLGYLLSKFRVKTLLLPLVDDLAYRLFLAFEYSIATDSEHIEFFINPTEYLLRKYDSRIDNIILVPPSSSNIKGDEKVVNPESIENGNLSFKAIKTERYLNTLISTLSPKGSLLVQDIFQFIPYNDASLQLALTEKFINAVENQKDQIFKESGSSLDFKSIIDSIKELYDTEFGKSAKKRNIISLFLFASPLNHSSDRIEVSEYRDVIDINRDQDYLFSPYPKSKNATLYTGDGYLDKESRLKSLRDYIGEENFKRISCFQVMHHGARSCWYEGLASDIKPLISVFSADATRKRPGHPHGEVLRDFLPHSPVLVDKENNLSVKFY
ncbi:MAG: DNA internalization-related competence protein ComEC/Rec2 [uncultured Sulfurovum sp.]|uniref:DNA internalization-related competence protein ComEC/Rec2 n=1 Tax=uncultured Sulfurovum sp. TaxID=269237 RepID=A0A6S6S5D4_9BACT|nr:MAG: DNA internalization-related competence protein ComEC/Rec2 [uncultured Sulfurovum sp.]